MVLGLHFEDIGDFVDIVEAISLQRKAIHLTPKGDADMPLHLASLGESLQHQFERKEKL